VREDRETVATSLESFEAGGYGGEFQAAAHLTELTHSAPPAGFRMVPGAISAEDGVWRPVGLLAATPLQLGIKRAMDLILGLLASIVLLPLLVIIAVLVVLTSRGPALYVHERVGRGGRPFRMYKFRSMYRNANEIKQQYMAMNDVNGPVFKCRRDPRMTPVGRLIRKLSLDELPQLINVLRGDMSLVGPRPPLPEEYGAYGPRELKRMGVVPGMTGVWQVSGRSDLDFETWIDLDILYIDTWSLWQDVKLLAQTLPAVVSGRGAY
jgi:lipopolysaccharide/colanic/teichoic acid biosynthesis glycosyltransferase